MKNGKGVKGVRRGGGKIGRGKGGRGVLHGGCLGWDGMSCLLFQSILFYSFDYIEYQGLYRNPKH